MDEAIKIGQFREDLYYRLNVITMHLPALRDRKEDIPELVNYFISRYSKETGKTIKGIAIKCLQSLSEYLWPGNVRQLENCIRRAVVLTKGSSIAEDDLEFDSDTEETTSPFRDENAALEKIITNIADRKNNMKLWPTVEKLLIEKTLNKTKGNQVQAARILGIHRNTLRNRIERYNLISS